MRLISDHFVEVTTRLPVAFLRHRHADDARRLGFARLVAPALVVMAGTSRTKGARRAGHIEDDMTAIMASRLALIGPTAIVSPRIGAKQIYFVRQARAGGIGQVGFDPDFPAGREVGRICCKFSDILGASGHQFAPQFQCVAGEFRNSPPSRGRVFFARTGIYPAGQEIPAVGHKP
jgi:hypothetical protein